VEAAARQLALDRFEEVARTEGFMRMDERVLGGLLDDDALGVSREEAALEAVVRWMKKSGGKLRGRGLLRKIRYCLFDAEYLAVDVHRLLPAKHADWIDGLVYEALRAKSAGHRRGSIGARLLGKKAHVCRAGSGVRWERYEDGGERRLRGHAGDVIALAECEEWVCSGSLDGSIRVWGGATLQHARAMRDEAEDGVRCLAAWEGRLVSGHDSGLIRTWDAATGECDGVQVGHTDTVRCLAVSGRRLVSGSYDMSVRVWAMGEGRAWPCERTLVSHAGEVCVLATWQDKALSGSLDATVRVWDVQTGALDATLTGHAGPVRGLAVHGHRLFSASHDGTIREWALGTWAALRTVEAHGRDRWQVPHCLAVCGSRLISGSADSDGADSMKRYEVRVWDLETLACERTLPQPVRGDEVLCLAAVRGRVWGGVGEEVVVWGAA
jgi:hypothetical protein